MKNTSHLICRVFNALSLIILIVLLVRLFEAHGISDGLNRFLAMKAITSQIIWVTGVGLVVSILDSIIETGWRYGR